MSEPGPRRTPPVDRFIGPFREFAGSSASSGVLLFGAAIVALAWANSPLAASYVSLWETRLTIGSGAATMSADLRHWINDGLMTLFFLVVGLEIKREVLVGELASLRRAAVPIGAALGGAFVPAVLFLLIVGSGEAARGWAVPMATDIAFALGVLALLGDRIPLGLRVFMAALAIVDDLVAVSIIGIFYTADISPAALAAAGGCLALLAAANALGVRRLAAYGVLGLGLWIAIWQSGVHPTLAGVLLAATIPARTRPSAEEVGEPGPSPMLRLEHALQPWVAFVIVPLFALANAGVALGGDPRAMAGEPIVLGIAIALVVGKQVGITAAVWLLVRGGAASLPDGVRLRHVYGAAWLGGIGFTMSLFVGDLAYGDGAALSLAKIGILAASLVAGTGGYLILRATLGRESGRWTQRSRAR